MQDLENVPWHDSRFETGLHWDLRAKADSEKNSQKKRPCANEIVSIVYEIGARVFLNCPNKCRSFMNGDLYSAPNRINIMARQVPTPN